MSHSNHPSSIIVASGNCMFCSAPQVTEVFAARRIRVRRSKGIPAELFPEGENTGSWSACARCQALVRGTQKDALVVRVCDMIQDSSPQPPPRTYLHPLLIAKFALYWAGQQSGFSSKVVMDTVCSPVQRALLDLYRYSARSTLPGRPLDRDLGQGVTVSAFLQPDALYFYDIFSTQPGRGYGSAVMNRLCSIADTHAITVRMPVFAYTFPGYRSGPSTTELIDWYGRFGFVLLTERSQAGHPLMERRKS